MISYALFTLASKFFYPLDKWQFQKHMVESSKLHRIITPPLFPNLPLNPTFTKSASILVTLVASSDFTKSEMRHPTRSMHFIIVYYVPDRLRFSSSRLFQVSAHWLLWPFITFFAFRFTISWSPTTIMSASWSPPKSNHSLRSTSTGGRFPARFQEHTLIRILE